jgi:U4/U6 small nuclear ribonucleoprotein PRP3
MARKQEQLAKLRAKIDEELRRKGLESQVVSDVLAAKKTPLPVLDWWHTPFVPHLDALSNIIAAQQAHKQGPLDERSLGAVRALLGPMDNVSRLIYHPAPFPMRQTASVPLSRPLMLTAAEQKKLRRQRRLAAQKEQREQEALGLRPKAAPKLTPSNYMTVLGPEALSDPTRAAALAQAQVAERQAAHLTANAARQLDKAARTEKARLKLARAHYEPQDGQLHILAFRLTRLDRPQWRFKIKMNARQLHLMGVLLQHGNHCLLIIEGGARAIRKFHRLMTERIRWQQEANCETPDGFSKESDDISGNRNQSVGASTFSATATLTAFSFESTSEDESICRLVWRGATPTPHFSKFEELLLDGELKAIDYLKEKQLFHLWQYAKQVDSMADAPLGDILNDI